MGSESAWEPVQADEHSSAREPAQDGSWRLLRQDDNGNQYEMARFATREQAEAEAERYQARGHKQLYYVERA